MPEDLAPLVRRRRRPARPSPTPGPALAGTDRRDRRAAGRQWGAGERAVPVDVEDGRRGGDPALDDDHRDALADHDDVVAGVQPAGRVLVVMVATLLLAMLVNADALVERAERRPAGPARDRSLAIWHPVQDVSHALQLHRLGELADRVVGDGGEAPAAPSVSPRSGREPTGQAEGTGGGAAADHRSDDGDTGAPQLRIPTEADPLRLWVGGDSMAQAVGQALMTASEASGMIETTAHYEAASGLARPDYFDWRSALANDVEVLDPEVVVVVLGVNDGQGIVLADGTPVPEVADPRWVGEYRRRVGALMDQLRAEERIVVWVSQPPMREPAYAARLAIVNQAYAAEAAHRPWVTLVDSGGVLGDPARAYTMARPGPGGVPVDVRRADGIHLTTVGADLLAAHVLDVIGRQVDLSGATATGD